MIKEPKGVDIVVEPNDYTAEKQQLVSDFLARKRKKPTPAKQRVVKTR